MGHPPFSRLAKPGQGSTSQADLTDQAVQDATVGIAQTTPATTGSPSDKPYKPVAGDVVEFEYKGKACQGLIFQHYKNPAIVSNFDHKGYYTFSHSKSFDTAMETARKIGETSLVKARHAHDDVIRIAKAYFSTPKFKVGDAVKVVKKGVSICGTLDVHDDEFVGTVSKIDFISGYGNARLIDTREGYIPLTCLELAPAPHFTGSYAEQQAQWVKHYGIKIDSKVKIAKGYKNGDDGFDMLGFIEDTEKNSRKQKLIGDIVTIRSLQSNVIEIKHSKTGNWSFPYFCLEPVQ